MTCEEAIAALQEAKNIFCATGSKGVILAKIKIKLKVLKCSLQVWATTTTTTRYLDYSRLHIHSTTVDEVRDGMVFNDRETPAGKCTILMLAEWNAF